MNTWPSNLSFQWAGHSFASAPDVQRTTTVSGHVRQRARQVSRDDIFKVSILVNDADLATFEAFVLANPGPFVGPYFDCPLAQTGTLTIMGGNYTTAVVQPNRWRVSFAVEVIDRAHPIGQQMYDLAQIIGAEFNTLATLDDAIARAVIELGP